MEQVILQVVNVFLNGFAGILGNMIEAMFTVFLIPIFEGIATLAGIGA